jgi:diadenosine tetraphosphatase ApaH/serine/threonine PP2A family protein phosphatase
VRIAIVSDIHGNLEALTAVLEDIDRRPVDEIVCLGDIVGYGPDPAACLAVIRGRRIPSFMGNHDQAAFDADLRTTFSLLARTAIEWTAPRLDDGDLAFLRSLPYRAELHGATFVHASPRDPGEFEYVMDDLDAARQFGSFTTPICFIGHTHDPEIFREDLGPRMVDAEHRCLVNVGSVGQPRDGNPKACYGLYDTGPLSFEHVRVAYDVPATAAKIYQAGLPAQLAERLVLGV